MRVKIKKTIWLILYFVCGIAFLVGWQAYASAQWAKDHSYVLDKERLGWDDIEGDITYIAPRGSINSGFRHPHGYPVYVTKKEFKECGQPSDEEIFEVNEDMSRGNSMHHVKCVDGKWKGYGGWTCFF